MALINFARKEIEAKVVYYGPAFSGKTTNVQILHQLVPERQRGDLHTMATEGERTLFFDYVPIQLGQIAGFTAKFKLFTVPGQVVYQQTRRVVLNGADAVVFVADSDPDRADANLDSLVDLEENLRAQGLDLASIPLVIQLNKRDAPNARPYDDMIADLNPFGVPVVEASASDGQGVLETLRLVTEIAANRIRENLSGHETAVKLTAIERPDAEDDHNVIRDHLERIRQVRTGEEAREQRIAEATRTHLNAVDAFLPADRGVNRSDPGRAVPPPPPADEKPPEPAKRQLTPAMRPEGREARPEARPEVRPAPRPPPAPERSPIWVAVASGVMIGLALGFLVGLAVGWLAFA